MQIKETKPKSVKTGDVVLIDGWPSSVSVKKIHLVFHMDNNMDVVVEENETMYVVKR